MSTIRARPGTIVQMRLTGPVQVPCQRIGPIAVVWHEVSLTYTLLAECGLAFRTLLPNQAAAFKLARAILAEVPASQWPPLHDPDQASPIYQTADYTRWLNRVQAVMDLTPKAKVVS